MNNYVPDSDAERLDMIGRNPLYLEILQRRMQKDCVSCDYAEHGAEICAECIHNSEDALELKPISCRKDDIKKMDIIRWPFTRKCPLCTNKNWTRLISVYITKHNHLMMADEMAKFCPLCGKELEEIEDEKVEDISFNNENEDPKIEIKFEDI